MKNFSLEKRIEPDLIIDSNIKGKSGDFPIVECTQGNKVYLLVAPGIHANALRMIPDYKNVKIYALGWCHLNDTVDNTGDGISVYVMSGSTVCGPIFDSKEISHLKSYFPKIVRNYNPKYSQIYKLKEN